MKKIYSVLAIVLLGIVVLVVYFFIGAQSADNSSADKSDLIRVSQPVADQVVKSPLVIAGTARGNWYFEASFPVKLIDANMHVIAAKPAQALSDWMTTEFVPFSANLEFIAPTSDTGFLVLEKDNPSGLPEHDDELRIAIKFR